MEFFELVRARHSVRAFTARPIEPEKLQAILGAANRAPSAGNLQAYEIYALSNRTELNLLAGAARQGFVAQAPLALVFCAHPARSAIKFGQRGASLYCIQDATIVCAYAQLAATALGLASVWVGAFDDAAVRRAVGVGKDLLPVAILPIGYAGEKAGEDDTATAGRAGARGGGQADGGAKLGKHSPARHSRKPSRWAGGRAMSMASDAITGTPPVLVTIGPICLEGNLAIPEGSQGIVLFAHGSGSSRHSPRNQYVARVLGTAGNATLLIDLLTEEEEAIDLETRHLRFDVNLLATRLVGATDWLEQNPETRGLRIGYFGASTGAGAALVAASVRPHLIGAVVSRGGRPDLAGPALSRVQAPTLLIVGGNDLPVIDLNREALRQLHTSEKKLVIIPGATHLFEEPGALEQVAELAAEWFARYLSGKPVAAGIH